MNNKDEGAFNAVNKDLIGPEYKISMIGNEVNAMKDPSILSTNVEI